MFHIEARGPGADPNYNRVVRWERTGPVVRKFDTAAEARAVIEEIKPSMPSKYYPLVVVVSQ
jgi:hypothetical protein